MGLDKTLVGIRYRAPHTYSIQGGGMGFSIRRWESSRKTGVFSIPLPYVFQLQNKIRTKVFLRWLHIWKAISFFTSSGTVSRFVFPFLQLNLFMKRKGKRLMVKQSHRGFSNKKQCHLLKFQIISHFSICSLHAFFKHQLKSNNLRWSTLHNRGPSKAKLKVHRKTLKGQASPCQRSRGERHQTGWWLAGSDCQIQTSNLSPCKEEEKSFHLIKWE